MPDTPEIAAVKTAAATQRPIEFVHRWLLSSNPFAFREDDTYHHFRAELSTLLDIHPAELTLVGSGQIGFSLNPTKLLRSFRGDSDLDVVVVSSSRFDDTWRNLLSQMSAITRIDEDDGRRLRKTQEQLFYGYLRPDVLPRGTHLVKEWFPKLAGPYANAIAKKHSVKAWLFKSWWHVEQYYCDGLAKVQSDIARMLAPGG